MSKTPNLPEPIEPGCILHCEEFLRRTSWELSDLLFAREQGLRVIDVAGNAYICSNDVIDFLMRAECRRRGSSCSREPESLRTTPIETGSLRVNPTSKALGERRRDGRPSS